MPFENPSPRHAGRKFGVVITVLLILFIVAVVGMSCVTTVPTGHTGVVTTFGSVENYTYDSGVHFKLPWQRVVMMDNRIQKQTVDLSCFSSDIQEVSMVYTVNYQINQANAQNIYRSIGTEYYNTVIVPCITESTKVITAKYTAENLVSQRSSLASAIEAPGRDRGRAGQDRGGGGRRGGPHRGPGRGGRPSDRGGGRGRGQPAHCRVPHRRDFAKPLL